jgi:DNA-binding Xre family transcriptional regulator
LQLRQTEGKQIRTQCCNPLRYLQDVAIKATGGRIIEVSPAWLKLLREAMARHGLDQQGVEAKTGVENYNVSRLLKTRHLRADNIEKLCRYYRLPLPYMLISSEEEAEWQRLGQLARRLTTDRYELLVTSVRAFCVGEGATADEADAALRRLLGERERQ